MYRVLLGLWEEEDEPERSEPIAVAGRNWIPAQRCALCKQASSHAVMSHKSRCWLLSDRQALGSVSCLRWVSQSGVCGYCSRAWEAKSDESRLEEALCNMNPWRRRRRRRRRRPLHARLTDIVMHDPPPPSA